MSAKSKRRKGRVRAPSQRQARPPKTGDRQLVIGEIPRPRVTEYSEITIVPVFANGAAGPPSGLPGRYEVVFVLGVPGVGSAVLSLNFAALAAGGDSLLHGSDRRISLGARDGPSNEARIVANAEGRLARIQLEVTADSFAMAETDAHDQIMPVVSGMAFAADAPVEVVAVLLTEKATQTRRVGATIIGAVQPVSRIEGLSTPEIRPFLAAYREGLNSNSLLYQALCFYKVIEGLSGFHTKQARAVSRSGGAAMLDPLSKKVPSDLNNLPALTPWVRDTFKPYLGMTFESVKKAVSASIRNAIAHITPTDDVRVADYLHDVQACRDITPVLRYIARELINHALTSSTDSRPASRPSSEEAEPILVDGGPNP